MKYFTRELYQSIQPQGGPPKLGALRNWEIASAEYDKQFAVIQYALPDALRAVATNFLHDARILEANSYPGGEIDLVLDRKECVPSSASYTLHCSSVKYSTLTSSAVGQYWLYEEVAALGDGNYSLCVLLNESEFSVIFAAIEAHPHGEGARRSA